jgi:hypothetical protein
MLMEVSTGSVAWSLMCPSEMNPAKPGVEEKVVFGGPKLPHWSSTLLWFPMLGRYLNALINALAVRTTYRAVADFMADDLEFGLDSQLIGMKVAPCHVP